MRVHRSIIKYSSVCNSSSEINYVEWTYPSVPEWKDLLLLLVSCGGQPIIGSVRTPVAYSIGIPFFHDAGARAKGSYRTEHGAYGTEHGMSDGSR